MRFCNCQLHMVQHCCAQLNSGSPTEVSNTETLPKAQRPRYDSTNTLTVSFGTRPTFKHMKDISGRGSNLTGAAVAMSLVWTSTDERHCLHLVVSLQRGVYSIRISKAKRQLGLVFSGSALYQSSVVVSSASGSLHNEWKRRRGE
jgi:hypothetical protein